MLPHVNNVYNKLCKIQISPKIEKWYDPFQKTTVYNVYCKIVWRLFSNHLEIIFLIIHCH